MWPSLFAYVVEFVRIRGIRLKEQYVNLRHDKTTHALRIKRGPEVPRASSLRMNS